MFRNIAVATAVLVCAAGAGKLAAQDTREGEAGPTGHSEGADHRGRPDQAGGPEGNEVDEGADH